MMPTELVNALTAVAERLVSLAAEDPQARAEIRRLAQALLAATETRSRPPAATASAPQLLASPSVPTAAVRIDPPAPLAAPVSIAVCAEPEALCSTSLPQDATEAPDTQPLPELTLGRASAATESPTISFPARWTAAGDADLPLILDRCRLKADGATWAARRRRRIADGVDFNAEIAPGDREIIARARSLPDCLLWMCRPDSPIPADLRLYDELSGCFTAVAEALNVLIMMHQEENVERGELQQALELLAEGQSALRVAIGKIDGPADKDQLRVFTWLKATTNENQVFISRYMRADDPADPTCWPELVTRIEAIRLRIEEGWRRSKQRRKLLGKVQHKLKLIADAPDEAHEHWRILTATVDELVCDGLPPSNRELRELLAPHLAHLPQSDDLPRGFRRVLREIERVPSAPQAPTLPAVSRTTAEVQEAARLLQGRSMLLIGGERRPIAEQSLKEAFGLRELFWITTREHESNDGFEPYIARPDIAVVVLAIRWSSHSYGEIRDFCERHGKPLVRLPAGYNSNQVAAQIIEQCSDRLRGIADCGLRMAD